MKDINRALNSFMDTDRARTAGAKVEILLFIDQNGRRPSLRAENEYERKLAEKLYNYSMPASYCFDDAFRDAVHKADPFFEREPETRKADIIDFCLTHGRRPRRNGDDRERNLWMNMKSYMSKSSQMFDPKFRAEVEAIIPTHEEFISKKSA
jgi:hypothetical protein